MIINRILSSQRKALRHTLGCVFTTAVLAATGCAQHTTKPSSEHTRTSHTGPQNTVNTPQVSQATKPGKTGREESHPLVVREDAPLEYVVKRGDTLWDIAGYFLQNPWQWPEIWHANSHIANPHLIYPGDTLYLSYVKGRPQVRRRSGETRWASSEVRPGQVRLRNGAPRGDGVRLEPKVNRKPLSAAVPTIPLSAIRPFLHGPRVVARRALKNAGYIVAFADRRILGDQGNVAYATDLGRHKRSEYQVVHPGKPYRDPQTGKILGYKATPTARAKLVSPGKNGEAASLKLVKSFQETAIGDRLLAWQEAPLSTGYYPHAAEKPVNGQIIAVLHSLKEIGRYQIVTLDVGASDGVDPGCVLSIYRPGGEVTDPHHKKRAASIRLPAAKTGELMVFQTADHLSHALILDSTRSIHVRDSVRNPHAD